MKKYFIYTGEYISGSQFWWRWFLQGFLCFMFVGFYLIGVTCYTRSKSLGFNDLVCWLFAIGTPICAMLAQFTVAAGKELAVHQIMNGGSASSEMYLLTMLFLLPMFILWFKDGKNNI